MKLIRIFHFSTVQFPYNFKGVIPSHDNSIQNYIKNIFSSQVNYGFLFAYKNLLESLTTSNYEEFIKENCDKKIGRALIEGKEKLKADGKELRLGYNDQVQSIINYGSTCIHMCCDQNIDLLDQKPDKVFGVKNKLGKLYTTGVNVREQNVQCSVIEVALYVRTPLFLFLNEDKHYEDAFHRIDFRTSSTNKLSISDALMVISQLMKFQQEKDYIQQSQMVNQIIGTEFTWKIFNIDEYFK